MQHSSSSKFLYIAGTYAEPSETSKMEHFTQIIDCFRLLTAFAKVSILDVLLGFKSVSGLFIEKGCSDRCSAECELVSCCNLNILYFLN